MTLTAPRFESRPRRSALGLRCWDPVADHLVTDGIEVTVRRRDGRGATQVARLTPNGHFAFHGLYGLHGYETTGAVPNPKPEFVLEVVDRAARYLPACRVLALPWEDGEPFLSSESPAVFEPAVPGLMLFSAPARRFPSGVEVIRADLYDIVNNRPAAYAVLTASVAGSTHYAVADAEGRVALPLAGLIPTPQAQWPVSVAVRYAALAAPYTHGGELPDQATVLTQAAATLRTDVALAAQAAMGITLHLGVPQVLRTTDDTPGGPDPRARHSLWIHPAGP